MSDKNEWEGRAQHTGAGPPTPSSPGQWQQLSHTPGVGVRQSTNTWLPPTPTSPALQQLQIHCSGWYQVNTGAINRYPTSASRQLFTDTRLQIASTSVAQQSLPAAVPPVTPAPGPGYPERTGRTPTGYILRPMGRLLNIYEEVSAEGYPRGRGGLSRLLPRTADGLLNDKTVRDLAKLRALGFDVSKFERDEKLGEGSYSKVFMGAYTGQVCASIICNKLSFCQPPLGADTWRVQSRDRYLPLSQRVILQPSVSGHQLPDIVSYRRMFLIMEYGDQGSLDHFAYHRKLNDRLTVQFTGELCSAMAYMHYNGVAHLDCHTNNIMVFSAPGGQFTVKYIDFGLSLSCPLYAKLGVQVWGSEWRKMAMMNMSEMAKVLHYMLDKCGRSRLNTGADLSQVRAMASELFTTKKHMFDVIKSYTF
ncbi:unnamed protein product [Medioppia subpectinata]|uniref:Protein kinase domain-containing protein n=1 Tax=Medioppia subpectinata TaxID=1979941 RepID=A0A7R9Q197_9ACAR|nr:unnamed protein product [Medioppia subpectinata]CAG2108081.1 unnamed protein product [Medioppia subpectinata]